MCAQMACINHLRRMIQNNVNFAVASIQLNKMFIK